MIIHVVISYVRLCLVRKHEIGHENRHENDLNKKEMTCSAHCYFHTSVCGSRNLLFFCLALLRGTVIWQWLVVSVNVIPPQTHMPHLRQRMALQILERGQEENRRRRQSHEEEKGGGTATHHHHPLFFLAEPWRRELIPRKRARETKRGMKETHNHNHTLPSFGGKRWSGGVVKVGKHHCKKYSE